jgi:hypothetical protein
MIILNEEKYARDVLTGRRTDVVSIIEKIDLISRYNYFVLHKSDDESYVSIVKWLEKHHDIFCEQNYSNIISKYVNKAKKSPFYHIDSIKITKKEMEIIQSQNNCRYEKLLFVLLCMAKVQKIMYRFDHNLIRYDIRQLFKMARVSVPADAREYILHEFLVSGLIELPKKNDTKCLFVNFVDDDESDLALEINEKDCADLAYCYLYFIKKGNVFRCSKCKKLTKQSKKFGDVCQECRESDGNQRTLWCVDCGEEFQVSVLNTKTCRCSVCQEAKNKELKALSNEKYYNNHKN